jgi:hypothetical protein
MAIPYPLVVFGEPAYVTLYEQVCVGNSCVPFWCFALLWVVSLIVATLATALVIKMLNRHEQISTKKAMKQQETADDGLANVSLNGMPLYISPCGKCVHASRKCAHLRHSVPTKYTLCLHCGPLYADLLTTDLLNNARVQNAANLNSATRGE